MSSSFCECGGGGGELLEKRGALFGISSVSCCEAPLVGPLPAGHLKIRSFVQMVLHQRQFHGHVSISPPPPAPILLSGREGSFACYLGPRQATGGANGHPELEAGHSHRCPTTATGNNDTGNGPKNQRLATPIWVWVKVKQSTCQGSSLVPLV